MKKIFSIFLLFSISLLGFSTENYLIVTEHNRLCDRYLEQYPEALGESYDIKKIRGNLTNLFLDEGYGDYISYMEASVDALESVDFDAVVLFDQLDISEPLKEAIKSLYSVQDIETFIKLADHFSTWKWGTESEIAALIFDQSKASVIYWRGIVGDDKLSWGWVGKVVGADAIGVVSGAGIGMIVGAAVTAPTGPGALGGAIAGGQIGAIVGGVGGSVSAGIAFWH